jgi:predicted transcriptional regulator
MTKLLEQALAASDKLPAETQDELARMILAIVEREGEVYELSEEELASLETSLAQADRGEFATGEEVAALWTKHGL